jgi:hypothetical protein
MAIKTYTQLRTEENDVSVTYSTHTDQILAIISGIIDFVDTVESVAGNLDSRIGGITASNLGTGTAFFSSRVIDDFQFKTLKVTGALSISSDATSVTIGYTDTDTVTSVANVGTGTGLVYQSNTAGAVTLRSILAGTLISVTNNTNDITIATTAEINTASNLGTGSGLFSGKVGSDLQFKSLKVSGALSISSDATSVTISYTDTDTVTSVANVGTGTGLVYQSNTGGAVSLRSLLAGSNITIINNANDITIAATSSGEANTASNLGTGTGIFSSKVGSDLQFKSLIAGSGTSITNTATEITITNNVVQGFTAVSNLGTGNVILGGTVPTITAKSLVAGTNVTITNDANSITINSTGAAVKGFIQASMSADQTTSLTVGNHVQFDTSDFAQSGLTVSSGSGQAKGTFTLAANKTYMLTGFIFADYTGAGSYSVDLRWRVVSGALFGKTAHVVSTKASNTESSLPVAGAVLTTTATTTVQLEITVVVGGFDTLKSSGCIARIQEI